MILISCFFPAQKAPSSEKYHHCISLKKEKGFPDRISPAGKPQKNVPTEKILCQGRIIPTLFAVPP
jgi:hypothetical protein